MVHYLIICQSSTLYLKSLQNILLRMRERILESGLPSYLHSRVHQMVMPSLTLVSS